MGITSGNGNRPCAVRGPATLASELAPAFQTSALTAYDRPSVPFSTICRSLRLGSTIAKCPSSTWNANRSPRSSGLLPIRVELQFLDLARERVAPEAEQMRRFDAAPAGVSERAQDERLLELPRELGDDRRFASIQE